jgi:uncharacterized membrane protein
MFSWGSGDFVTAGLSRSIGSLRALLWVTIVCDLSIVLYAAATGAYHAVSLSAIPYAVAGGLCHTVGSMSYYKGLKVGRVSLVTPISSGWSLILVLAAILLYGEALTALQGTGIALVIIGSVLVSANLRAPQGSSKFTLSDPGIAYGFLAMLGWGIGFLFLNEAVKEIGWVIPNVVLALSMTAFVLLYSALSRQSVAPPAAVRDRVRAIFVGLATILAYASYSIGIERYLTSVVGPLAAAYPLVTVVLAVVILREKTAINQKIGIAGVIGGVVLLAV